MALSFRESDLLLPEQLLIVDRYAEPLSVIQERFRDCRTHMLRSVCPIRSAQVRRPCNSSPINRSALYLTVMQRGTGRRHRSLSITHDLWHDHKGWPPVCSAGSSQRWLGSETARYV